MELKAARRHREFLKQLGCDLVLPSIEVRAQNVCELTNLVQSAMSIVLKRSMENTAPAPAPDEQPDKKRRKCSVYIQQSHCQGHKAKKEGANKVKNQICVNCKRPVCSKHAVKTVSALAVSNVVHNKRSV